MQPEASPSPTSSPGTPAPPEASTGRRVILVHPLAPSHPGLGQPCSGCGLCCLWQPCPLGMVVTRKLHGACRALVWSSDQQAYRCGLLAEPKRHVSWLPEAWVRRLAQRWIAAGAGCDAPLEQQDTPEHPG